MGKQGRAPLTPLLRRCKALFDLIKRTTDEYLVFVDIETRTALLSPNLVRDFGLPAEVVADFGAVWTPLVHPEERDQLAASLTAIMERLNVFEHAMEYRVRDRSGDYVWLRSRGRVGTLGKDGAQPIFVSMIRRMANRNQADDITGLLNKYQFEHSLRVALSAYRITGQGGAVMVLGIDNFKIVNETFNRMFGDRVLKLVADVILALLPEELTLYKLDGDEYGIIYPAAEAERAQQLYENVQKALTQPFDLDGHRIFLTVSAGTVLYPQAGKDYLVLQKHAEAAMDLAKRAGKNRNCLFSKEQYNRWVRSISMRDDLRASVEEGCSAFRLMYQPQVDARTRRLIGAEALLRWRSPRGRMVAPMEFIPLLEETKLILPVGKWLLEQAVQQARAWRALLPDFHMSVNMSYEQVRDLSFREFVPACLARYGVPPEAVTLELTESRIVADWHFVNEQFDEYRRQGIRIAMDDFGTGYSSLGSLKNLSCDIVKLDRAFVQGITDGGFDQELVCAVTALCHSIGMRVCVEGVEEESAYERLRDTCQADAIQGYLFGHPEAPENFAAKFIAPYPDHILPTDKGEPSYATR